LANDLKYEEFEKLNNFFWFFSLDLKSSKRQLKQLSIIGSIKHRYNKKSWDFDITSKRIISWLSNHQLTYEDCEEEFKKNLTKVFKNKQIIFI
jgi:uncharacterized heparinase superfamily protein